MLVLSRKRQESVVIGGAHGFLHLLKTTVLGIAGGIVLSGSLPPHHLKQLLQEAIRGVPGVVDIDNQVDVLWPTS